MLFGTSINILLFSSLVSWVNTLMCVSFLFGWMAHVGIMQNELSQRKKQMPCNLTYVVIT